MNTTLHGHRATYRRGFTIIELLIVATFAALLFILFFVQKSNLDAIQRDEQRQTAINAFYYGLEESFYKDHGYYPEQLGEDNLPVPDGQPGEVVVTTLGVEGMPLLRFRTGDISRKIPHKCVCGRNSYRLAPIVGRKNNMIKLKGTTLYPPAINDVLDNTPYVRNYVVIVRDSQAGTDEVIVRAGVEATNPPADLVKDLKDRFRSKIRVAPIVEICQPDQINRILNPADNRKPLKFIDQRTKK